MVLCSIFGEHFRLFAQKFRGAIEVLYMNEKFFATLRWFSIGSEHSIAHWTLFCTPEGISSLLKAKGDKRLFSSPILLYLNIIYVRLKRLFI